MKTPKTGHIQALFLYSPLLLFYYLWNTIPCSFPSDLTVALLANGDAEENGEELLVIQMLPKGGFRHFVKRQGKQQITNAKQSRETGRSQTLRRNESVFCFLFCIPLRF